MKLPERYGERTFVRRDHVQPRAERFANVGEGGLSRPRVERRHLDEHVGGELADRRGVITKPFARQRRREIDAALVDDRAMARGDDRGDGERVPIASGEEEPSERAPDVTEAKQREPHRRHTLSLERNRRLQGPLA